MLIRFFKTNQPASFLALPFFAALLWIPSWIHPAVPAVQGPMPLYKVMDLLNGLPYVSEILAFALIIAQGFYTNYIVNKYDLRESYERSNFLTALFCIFFLSLFAGFRTLLPQHFAGLFLLFMLDRIFSSYRKENAFNHCFDAGFLAGMASLFYFPSCIFFFLVWAGFVILRPFNWREWVISFLGFIIPWLLVMAYYFWFDRLNEFFTLQVAEAFSTPYFQYGSPKHAVLIFVFVGILIPPATLNFIRAMSSGKVRTNKFFMLFTWFLFFALVSGVAFSVHSYTHFSLLAIPLSVMFANWFLTLKKTWVSESLFAVLVGAFIYAEVMGMI